MENMYLISFLFVIIIIIIIDINFANNLNLMNNIINFVKKKAFVFYFQPNLIMFLFPKEIIKKNFKNFTYRLYFVSITK